MSGENWQENQLHEINQSLHDFLRDGKIPARKKYIVTACYPCEDAQFCFVHRVKAATHLDAFEAAVEGDRAAGRYVEGAVFQVIGHCNDNNCGCGGEIRKVTYGPIM